MPTYTAHHNIQKIEAGEVVDLTVIVNRALDDTDDAIEAAAGAVTIDQATATAYGNGPASVTQIVSWFAKKLKEILGTANWYTAAPTDLTTLNGLFNASTGHAHDAAGKGKPITTAGIADNAVTNAKMADDSVSTAEIVDGAVTGPKIASNAVGATQIQDGAVTSKEVNLDWATADVVTSETTTSTSYTDLATVGPAITLSPGAIADHLLICSGRAKNSVAGNISALSPAIAGATALDADKADCLLDNFVTVSRSTMAPLQANGATHTLKYKVSGGTGTFSNRRILGLAI